VKAHPAGYTFKHLGFNVKVGAPLWEMPQPEATSDRIAFGVVTPRVVAACQAAWKNAPSRQEELGDL
jgi:hypothetical protein